MVSIILPTYNGEKYIKKSIESCLNQTFQNFELIIVDDCSTDDTPKIIQKFAKQDSRIKIITNAKNRKLPESLNIGFQSSSGKYLTWTSDDNIYKEDAIEVMISELEFRNCNFVYTDMDIIDENDLVIKYSRSMQNLGNPSELPIYNTVGACFLYTREVYDTIGDYDAKKELVEDWDYWFKIYLIFKIVHIPKSLYMYREHSENLTSTRKKEQYYKIISFINESCNKFCDFIPDDIRMRAYLRAANCSMKIEDIDLTKKYFNKAIGISNSAIYYTNEQLTKYLNES